MHYPGREQVPSCPGIACELKILGTQLMLVTLQTYVFWITRPALNSLFGNRQNQKQPSVTVFSGVCVHCHIMGLNLTQYESHILFFSNWKCAKNKPVCITVLLCTIVCAVGQCRSLLLKMCLKIPLLPALHSLAYSPYNANNFGIEPYVARRP